MMPIVEESDDTILVRIERRGVNAWSACTCDAHGMPNSGFRFGETPAAAALPLLGPVELEPLPVGPLKIEVTEMP